MVQRAAAFDTGNAALGYTLKGVTLQFAATTGSPANVIVAIHEPASAGSSDPKTTALVTLTGADQPGAGLHTYACSGSGCALARNTTYLVKVSAPNSPQNGYHSLRLTTSDAETAHPAASGWSIADTSRVKSGSNAWTASGNGETFVAHIAAEANVPTLTASAITATGATLTIAHHTAQWWYKANTGPDATCQGPVAANTSTKALTGLTASTSYVYKAYSATGCADTVLLATASSFTTLAPSLTVSQITATSATITIAGHSAAWYYQAASGPDATCKGPVAANTSAKALTGLTAGTSYVYKAYSASGCEASTLLATAASFTTSASLTVSAITATTATLTIAGHSAAWYYQADTGPDATCQGPVAANTSTEGLTGLTAGTSYVYKAYSASGCADTVLLATASSFTTLHTLTASNVGATTATLTIGSTHTGDWYYKHTTPSSGTCSSIAVTGSSANLTGLTGNAAYIFAAYSDSGCLTLLATASPFITAVSVSNLNETASGYHSVGGFNRTASFTTGAASGGYTLNSVTVKFGTKNGSPNDVAVKIYGDSSGEPGSEVANLTLTGPASPDDEDATYTCSGSGCSLSAGTTYHIHLSRPGASGSYRWRKTASDTETNAPSGGGWLIGNSGHHQTSGANYWTSHGEVGMFEVTVTPPPPTLTASNVGTTTATLTQANHSGNWRYKYTTPATPAGACSASQSGASANVTGLTPGTTYVFKLYGGADSTCAAPLATASSFTTAVSVSNLNETASGYHSVGGFNRTASFTTGAASGGYTLNSVTVKFGTKNGSPNDVDVKIYGDSSGEPGLGGRQPHPHRPASPDNEDATYTCSGSGCSLSVGATYHIHLSRPGASGAYRWRKTASDTRPTRRPAAAGSSGTPDTTRPPAPTTGLPTGRSACSRSRPHRRPGRGRGRRPPSPPPTSARRGRRWPCPTTRAVGTTGSAAARAGPPARPARARPPSPAAPAASPRTAASGP